MTPETTERQKCMGVVKAFSDDELRECMVAILKWNEDLLIHGQSIVKADSPLGRLMEAQEMAKCSTPETP